MKKSNLIIAVLSIVLSISACTDRNNNGEPDNKDQSDKDHYGNSDGNSESQGSENYPGNSAGTNTEDKRYGADPEVNKSDTIADDSTHHHH